MNILDVAYAYDFLFHCVLLLTTLINVYLMNTNEIYEHLRKTYEIGVFMLTLYLMNEYYETYIHKSPSMNSYVGDKWIG